MAGQEILPPDNSIGARALDRPSQMLFGQADGLRGFVSQPAIQRSLPAIATLGAVAIAASAWWAMQSPAQMPLFQGLTDADKSAVADALQTSGIAYSIDRDTGSIQVSEYEVHKARMVLAGQGLPKAAPAGDALIAALPMGSSRAVEGETLRGAREADLARTIEAIDAVKTARIHLATPEPSVFVRDTSAPAASVMLTLQQGRTLTDAQVRAIRHLVASSVTGLTPEQVSIVDQTGALLSQDDPNAQNRNFALQMQMEERYRQALVALLGPIVGPGNFSVEVHADIEQAESQSTRETYPKDDQALRREEGNRSTAPNADAGTPGGIPGALANQPPPATQVATTPATPQAAAPGQPGNQSNETYARSFDVGREISVTHNPQGRLTRLTVAVALRDTKGAKAKTPAEIAAIDGLIKGAVGFNAARGDVVALSARPFAEAIVVPVAWWDAPWVMPAARQLGGLLVALLVFFLFGRPIIKMLRNKVAARAEINAALEQSLLDESRAPERGSKQAVAQNPGDSITLEMIEAAPSYEARAALVRSFVAQDPERAALVVRQLIQERTDAN
ncbi:MAG: flagellar basal-body MS-ring/collar protein FliF [Pseudomonadota bacterium]